jgi:hypothetical protein
MQIRLILEVDDPADVDEHDGTGLTEAANDRLNDALADAGFSIISGPDKH